MRRIFCHIVIAAGIALLVCVLSLPSSHSFPAGGPRNLRPARTPAPAVAAPRPSPHLPALPGPQDPAHPSLRGSLVDAYGSPLPDVEIFAVPGDASHACVAVSWRSALTDARGLFTFQDLVGPVRLVIDGIPRALVYGPGPHRVRLPTPSRILGVVRDEQFQGIPGARIILDGEATVSDAQGRFERGPLACGKGYVIEAFAAGFRPVRTGTIVLSEGHEPWVDLVLQPGLSLYGRVRTPEGLPVAGAVLRAYQGDGFLHDASSAEDGSFRIDGLSPRPWRVFADREGFEPENVSGIHPSAPSMVTMRRSRS